MRLITLTLSLGLMPALALADIKDLDCATVGALIGDPVSDLVYMSGAEFPDTWQSAPDQDVLVCSWYTEPNARLFAGGELTTPDYQDLGLLVAQIAVYQDPLPYEVANTMNMAYPVTEEDWVFGLRAPVLTAPITPMPMELRDDSATGISVAGGATLGESAASLSGLTQGWSIEAAVRIRDHVAGMH